MRRIDLNIGHSENSPTKPVSNSSLPVNLSAAIVLCFSLINGAIGINGISLITTITITGLLALAWLKRLLCFQIEMVFITFIVLAAFLISFLRLPGNKDTELYFEHFILFCMITMLVGLQKLDIETVLKLTVLIGLICIIIMIQLRGIYNYDASHQMGISYSILPVLFSSFILIAYFHKFRIISIANISLGLYVYFNTAPRGVWMIILVYFSFLFFFNMLKTSTSWKRSFKIALLIVVFYLIIAYVINNVYQIVMLINNCYFSITGQRIYAINKLVFFLNNDGMTNGRDQLWGLAIETIKTSLIWGSGIGYFESIAGGYSHNLILQSLCEAGLFFFIPVVWFIIQCLRALNSLAKSNKAEFYFYNMLFSCGIVVLFYSSVYWKLFVFWFLLGYTIQYYKRIPVDGFEGECK